MNPSRRPPRRGVRAPVSGVRGDDGLRGLYTGGGRIRCCRRVAEEEADSLQGAVVEAPVDLDSVVDREDLGRERPDVDDATRRPGRGSRPDSDAPSTVRSPRDSRRRRSHTSGHSVPARTNERSGHRAPSRSTRSTAGRVGTCRCRRSWRGRGRDGRRRGRVRRTTHPPRGGCGRRRARLSRSRATRSIWSRPSGVGAARRRPPRSPPRAGIARRRCRARPRVRRRPRAAGRPVGRPGPGR